RHDSKPIPCRGFVQTAVSKARPPGLLRCSEVIPPARSRYSTNVFRSQFGLQLIWDVTCTRCPSGLLRIGCYTAKCAAQVKTGGFRRESATVGKTFQRMNNSDVSRCPR